MFVYDNFVENNKTGTIQVMPVNDAGENLNSWNFPGPRYSIANNPPECALPHPPKPVAIPGNVNSVVLERVEAVTNIAVTNKDILSDLQHRFELLFPETPQADNRIEELLQGIVDTRATMETLVATNMQIIELPNTGCSNAAARSVLVLTWDPDAPHGVCREISIIIELETAPILYNNHRASLLSYELSQGRSPATQYTSCNPIPHSEPT